MLSQKKSWKYFAEKIKDIRVIISNLSLNEVDENSKMKILRENVHRFLRTKCEKSVKMAKGIIRHTSEFLCHRGITMIRLVFPTTMFPSTSKRLYFKYTAWVPYIERTISRVPKKKFSCTVHDTDDLLVDRCTKLMHSCIVSSYCFALVHIQQRALNIQMSLMFNWELYFVFLHITSNMRFIIYII